MSETLPPPGHNEPPHDPFDRDTILMQLEADHIKLTKRRDDLIESHKRWKEGLGPNGIENDEQAQLATTFGTQIAALEKAVETARKAAKAPFDSGAAVVQGFFNASIAARLAPMKKEVADAVNAFQLKKEKAARENAAAEAKQAADRAAKLAAAAIKKDDSDLMDAAAAMSEKADKAAAIAAAPAATLAKVSGTYGGGASLRTTWKAEVTDMAKLVAAVNAGLLPLHYLQADMAAIGADVRNKGKPFRTTPAQEADWGVRVYEDMSTSFRT